MRKTRASYEPLEYPGLQLDTDSVKMLGLASCTGAVTALGIIVFKESVHELQHLAWGGLSSLDIRRSAAEDVVPRLLLLPTGGGLLVGVLHWVAGGWDPTPAPAQPGAAPAPATSLSTLRSWLRVPVKTAAAAVSLGSGASLGPEGPSVQLGRWLGEDVLSKALPINKTNRTVLAGTGLAAAVAACFAAPLSGTFFAWETLFATKTASSGGEATRIQYAACLLGSVVAAVVSRAVFGNAPAVAVNRVVDLSSPADALLCAALGLMCGAISTASFYTDKGFANVFNRAGKAGVPYWARTTLGGLAVGGIALAFPEVRYQGFADLNSLLARSMSDGGTYMATSFVVEVMLAKIVATSLCRGAGLVGGIYAPSILIGGLAGYSFATGAGALLHAAGINWVVSQQGYALVGIAGMLAANCKIPLTALLLLLELKGDYSCVASAAAAVSLSYWLSSYCETIPAAVPTADKADSSGTDEPGLIATPDVWRVSRMEELMELDRMTVRLEMQRPTTIPATASIVETITAMKGHPCLFVIDASGALKGVVTPESLLHQPSVATSMDSMEVLAQCWTLDETARKLQAATILSAGSLSLTSADMIDKRSLVGETAEPITCLDDETLADALVLMEEKGITFLPVVSAGGSKPVGLIDIADLRQQQLAVLDKLYASVVEQKWQARSSAGRAGKRPKGVKVQASAGRRD